MRLKQYDDVTCSTRSRYGCFGCAQLISGLLMWRQTRSIRKREKQVGKWVSSFPLRDSRPPDKKKFVDTPASLHIFRLSPRPISLSALDRISSPF
jgi:hypothetical protein